MPFRAVFFGSPDAAVPTLDALHESRHEVLAVVTSPDLPRGRGMKLRPTPVKTRAASLGYPVLEMRSLKRSEAAQALRDVGADLFVVTAYGAIFPPAVLSIPPAGCINVHFSLLPRLRGAAPVQWALIEGATLTGVSIMQMDEGMDTGPVFSVLEEPIMDDDNAGTLEARLAVRGAELLIEVLDGLEAVGARPNPQPDKGASRAPKITTTDARIEWDMTATSIRNRVRAFNPRPGAWTIWRGRRLKLWRVAESFDAQVESPGTLDVASLESLLVDTGEGRIALEEVQPEGASKMSVAEFIRGYRPQTGELLE